MDQLEGRQKEKTNIESNKGDNENLAIDVRDIERRLEGYLSNQVGDQSPSDRMFDGIKDKLKVLPDDLRDILSEQLDQLHSKKYETDDEMVYEVSTLVADFINSHYTPEEYEKLAREYFVEQSGFKPLNEVLSYGATKHEAHIHVAPAKTIPALKLGVLMKRGLSSLAEQLQEDPKLKKVDRVSATSWLVATKKGARILEKLGFTLDGPINEKLRQKHFANELRQVHSSHMDREDFVEKYYRPKKKKG